MEKETADKLIYKRSIHGSYPKDLFVLLRKFSHLQRTHFQETVLLHRFLGNM